MPPYAGRNPCSYLIDESGFVLTLNIGGRITPGLLEQLGLLGRIGQFAEQIPGGGGEFHIIVLHHTDCGIIRLAGDPAMLAQYFQTKEGELKAKAVTTPRAAVAVDIGLLSGDLRIAGRLAYLRPRV